MERVIKFRGKRVQDGTWVFGEIHIDDLNRTTIEIPRCQYVNKEIPRVSLVDEKTIGQFTGLYDSKGVEIYEGDVCRLDCYPHWNQIMCVGWHKETAHFGFRIRGESYIGCNDAFSDWIREKRITVIGNIYDNPDWEERK